MQDVKRLYRSRHERKLAGVCAGLGEYIEVDPTIVRVLYLLGTIITGFFPGIFIYFAMALIMPVEPRNHEADEAD